MDDSTMMNPESSSLPLISKSTVFPAQTSHMSPLQLSVSDLMMLSCHYIQQGGLYSSPPHFSFPQLLSHLKTTLSKTLTYFPPLAGRLTTDSDGHVYITCNDAGVDFIYADGSRICMTDLLGQGNGTDVPEAFKSFFALDGIVGYEGHFRPLLTIQVTELADGAFIGCSVNHAVVDGASFWNFFNGFAELSRGAKTISRTPDFSRYSVLISPVVLKILVGGPKVTFITNAPMRDRIFSLSGESILKLKAEVNSRKSEADDAIDHTNGSTEISSYQSLCALLWRGITRARKLPSTQITTFKMVADCRNRIEPKLDPLYFGNAIQIVPTYATAGDVLTRGLRWCAEQLNKTVTKYDGKAVRKCIEDWERNPGFFPLENSDGAMILSGSSPRFPAYEIDFGWGGPVRTGIGRGNTFDGVVAGFPGRDGSGHVEVEVFLAPETMTCLESDSEFVHFISAH